MAVKPSFDAVARRAVTPAPPVSADAGPAPSVRPVVAPAPRLSAPPDDRTSKLICEVPAGLHHRLKQLALTNGTTLRELVTKALQEAYPEH